MAMPAELTNLVMDVRFTNCNYAGLINFAEDLYLAYLGHRLVNVATSGRVAAVLTVTVTVTGGYYFSYVPIADLRKARD
jgi:hypothetical protein